MDTAPTTSPSLAALRASRIVAILRASSSTAVAAVADVLSDAGVSVIELPMTTPDALATLVRLRERLPDASLGVGTVLEADTARRAIEAGAEYLVTPTVEPDVIAVATEAGIPTIVGAMTPTEILAAWRLGATAVKVFPISALGGVDYVRGVRGPLPQIPLVPTGGVDIGAVAAYIDAGCLAVGLGSPLVGDALDGGSLVALADRARRAVESAGAA